MTRKVQKTIVEFGRSSGLKSLRPRIWSVQLWVKTMLPKLSESAFELSDRKMGVNYGLNKLRFPAPVPAGSKIRARFTLAKLEKIDGGVQTVWSVVVEREGGDKPVMVAETVSRHYY